MKKATKIFGILAAGLLAIGSVACSDNLNTDLEPIKNERTLSVTDAEGKEFPEHTLDLGAAPSNTAVKVVSNTRWAVEITDCEGGWCEVDVLNASGDGSFTITVLDNMKEERNCYVTVYKTDAQGNKETDGSYQLKVHQAVSDVRLSPSSLESFGAYDNERQEFNIISNVAWTLDITYEGTDPIRFVSITPTSQSMNVNGDGTFSGNGAASFYINLEDNRSTADRKAYLNLHSEVADYEVELTQLGSEYSFVVSPTEPQTVPAQGGTIEFGVQSLSDWDVSNAADWIVFSNLSGESSANRVSTVATILPNYTGNERDTVITFKPKDGNYKGQTIIVRQDKPAYTFSVMPVEQMVPAEGGAISFDVLSLSDWGIISKPDWITFTDYSGTGSWDRSNTTVATISPNETGRERYGEIYFGAKGYSDQRVIVFQRGYDLTFEVNRDEYPGVVMAGDTVINIELASRFNWEVNAPSWMHASPARGNKSDTYQEIAIRIDRNTTNDNRPGTITITPLPTEFSGGITLYPDPVGVRPIRIGITQFGGREAAISVPWLVDGYGQTYATVEFNYYSPYTEVTAAGLQWRKAGTEEWITVNASISNPIEGVVSVDLRDLDPATHYEARGFVMDNTGRTIYGTVSYPFTTAGYRPGAGDNPTPTRKR